MERDQGRSIGCVKWFNNQKGFGFIHSEGQDYFVHHSEITAENVSFRYLVQGEYVHFSTKAVARSNQNKDGVMAHNVTGLNNGFLMCQTRAANMATFVTR